MPGEFKRCINCKERKVGCHSSCEHYKAGKENTKRTRDRRVSENAINACEFSSIRKKKKK